MPEMHFRIRWPGGSEERCYSPSLVIKDFFTIGRVYPIGDFVQRSRDALTTASERVRARYGVPCSLALHQLQTIESSAASFATVADARVTVLTFEE